MVGWGAPLFLLGLVSLVVPFFLLFIKARARQVTNFSSLYFLRTVTEKASRVVEWKRLLLLISRILLLLSLTLAFALPFLSRTTGIFGRQSTQLIFVLDDSYSMAYLENGRTLFDLAKEKGKAIFLKYKKRNSPASIYLFHGELTPLATGVTQSETFRKKLESAEVSNFKGDFTRLRSDLRAMLKDRGSRPVRVFILSDFSIPDTSSKAKFLSEFSESEENISFELVPVQSASYRNFALDHFIFSPQPFLAGEEATFEIAYHSYNLDEAHMPQVKLWIGEDLVETVRPEPVKSGRIQFKYHFPSVGQYQVRVETSADGLETDNHRYAVINVRNPLRLLVLEDAVYEFPFQNPYFYVNQALQSGASGERPWVTLIKMSSKDLRAAQLNTYDGIVTAGVVRFEPGTVSALTQYVKEGGTLLFAPGNASDLREYGRNAYLTKLLGGEFSEVETAPSAEAFHLKNISYSHPLFQIFHQGKDGDLSEVNFSKFANFRITEAGRSYESLLWFESDKPALIETSLGQGKVFIWTSSLNTDWTDFPKNPLFVPFIFEWVKYAVIEGRGVQEGRPLEDPFVLELGKDPSVQAAIMNAKGEQTNLFADDKRGRTSFRAEKPGFYEWVKSGNGFAERDWIAFNVSSTESEPAYLPIIPSHSSESHLATSAGAKQPRSTSLAGHSFLYRPLLYTVLLLLLIEVLLANKLYHTKLT